MRPQEARSVEARAAAEERAVRRRSSSLRGAGGLRGSERLLQGGSSGIGGERAAQSLAPGNVGGGTDSLPGGNVNARRPSRGLMACCARPSR